MVENRLSVLLSMAKKWNAIVLVDEADVFMQERAIQDLDRNALVSSKSQSPIKLTAGDPAFVANRTVRPTAFLRILEYFEGTMFLTTNRAETLDSAFHSRIHLSISYPSLPPTALSELWISGITRACGGRRPRWIAGALLRTLSSSGINGREVKNIISMAYGLASREKRAIKPADILYGLEALKSFEAEFKTNR